MSSSNCESFTSSFPNWIPLIYFSSLIAVARTSKTMLNNSGHPCLPDLRGNALSFSPLRIIFAVGLSYMAFTMLKYSKAKFSRYSGYFLTSYFGIRVSYNEKDIFLGCEF